jgi:Dolichyl-phosphate-mannose-protein mannosyltransferase
MANQANTHLLRLSEWVMAGCVVAAALLTLWHGVGEARLPFQLDYEEGNILNAAVRLDAGQTAYPDPAAYPNVLDPYGPVGYFLAAECVRLGGLSFTLARLVMLVCGAAIAIVLVLLAREWTGSGVLAAAFGLYFIANGVTRAWLPLLRVDMLAIALSLAGFWLCMPAAADERSAGRWWLPSALLFALALFVKYTALAAPAACVLYLLARREFRRAVLLAGALAALSLAGFAGMQAATGGQFFFHMFRTHPDPYTFRRLLGIFILVEPSVVALVPLLAAFFLTKARQSLPALLYLLCAVGVVLVTGGKAGSFINHFLEPIAACTLAGALGYQAWAESARAPRLLPLLPCLLGGVALYMAGAFTQSARVVPLNVSGCGDVYRLVRDSPARRALAENVGAVVLAGRVPEVSNPFVLNQLVRHRELPAQPLEQMVAERQFGMIVLDNDPETMEMAGSTRWWPRLVRLMDRNYRVAKLYDCSEANVVLEPRSAPNVAAAPAPTGQQSGSGSTRP